MESFETAWSVKRVTAVVFAAVVTLVTLIALPKTWENVDAHEIMVVQAPWSGNLTCYTDPGLKWQGLGRVTKYPRRAVHDFSTVKGDEDHSARLRFNDGGHANMYGSVNWEMPLSCPQIVELHKTFGSAEGVADQGVAKMLDLAVYLSGPLMSSTESSGEKRAELTQLINDQAQNGVYQTTTKTVEVVDPITGEHKQAAQVEIVRDSTGQPKRQQGSILHNFGVTLLPISIKEIRYDAIVEAQIAERQKATTQVQIAIANARKAEQDAITIAKQGEAAAAAAKWKQEEVKATAVTLAQQNLEVQRLKTQEAEQYRVEQIRRGEGDAERRRLVMTADGALDSKLQTWLESQKVWADAFAKSNFPMVPSVVMGGGAQGSTSSVTNMQGFVELLSAKAARDLSLDLTVTGRKAKP